MKISTENLKSFNSFSPTSDGSDPKASFGRCTTRGSRTQCPSSCCSPKSWRYCTDGQILPILAGIKQWQFSGFCQIPLKAHLKPSTLYIMGETTKPNWPRISAISRGLWKMTLNFLWLSNYGSVVNSCNLYIVTREKQMKLKCLFPSFGHFHRTSFVRQ